MKNIYAIGAYQMSRDGFVLDVVYENTALNTDTYGNLYNWYAVNDSRGLCPVGWHVPSENEYTALINFLGGMINPDTEETIVGTYELIGGKMKQAGTARTAKEVNDWLKGYGFNLEHWK